MASATPTSNPASPPHRPPNPASPPNKRDLKSWWKGFKLPSKHHEAETKAPGIFGVPLRQSITYANVAISLIDENGQSYIYGYVPIVVAKCGVFLKEKATGIEGIFRLSGSEKRIKELKQIFDSPDRYGKGLVWEGYTVHDASNVLRRYLNDLPEPVVPLDLYEKFRDPLRGATKQAVGDVEGPQFVENFDEMAAIEKYQSLITKLPPLNRQLLLYILDLLAVFAAKSDENRMNSQNLAAIFQPGMLSHPEHAMAPEEYRLNQCVIIFLIENQDHFLIGMQGTAADEKTKKEVESGTPTGPLTPNPNRKSGLARSASNASAAAESVRRDGQLRRNRSVSSKHSKNDGTSSPNSPAVATTPTSGLGRSNTVPSKKSPALVGGKFKKQDSPNRRISGSGLNSLTPARPVEEIDESPAEIAAVAATSNQVRSQEKHLEVPPNTSTPSKERNLQNLFQRSPTDGSDKRQPNKLRKKRGPGTLNQSAHSSSVSLTHSNTASPNVEAANPMEQSQPLPPIAAQPQVPAVPSASAIGVSPQPSMQQPKTDTANANDKPQPVSEAQPPQSSDLGHEAPVALARNPPSDTLHPSSVAGQDKKTPPESVHSSYHDGSDMEQHNENQSTQLIDNSEKEKKRRWRLSSRAKKDDNSSGALLATSPPRVNIGSNDKAEASMTSIGSGSQKPRKSFNGDASEQSQAGVATPESHRGGKDDKDELKNPIDWIKNKYREAKETARNKSPPPDRQGLAGGLLSRGKSVDLKRDSQIENKEQSAQNEASETTSAAANQKLPSQETAGDAAPDTSNTVLATEGQRETWTGAPTMPVTEPVEKGASGVSTTGVETGAPASAETTQPESTTMAQNDTEAVPPATGAGEKVQTEAT